MSLYDIARFLHFNDDDDATDIIQYVSTEKREKILDRLQEKKQKRIRKLLTFGKETAGGLMDLDYVAVNDTSTIKEISEKVQSYIEREKRVPLVVVTSESGKLIGYLPHKNLIYTSSSTPLSKLIQQLPTLRHSIDQEQIVNELKHLTTEEIGVTDNDDNIIGVIHVRDLLRIAQTEATEDIYGFAGVEKEEIPTDPILSKVNRRYKWLIINLATAFLASAVVSMFEDTISRLALLAVYMPIVAGEGGNAATQSLAVVVRGLAVEEISWEQARGIIIKEGLAGVLNGFIVGTVSAVISFIFGAPLMLGVVLGVAMIVNLLVAGLFGALVPFILKSMKIDPAIASSIFVTTATDIIGFFVFLGLGSMLLLK
jgi:magnesium transporter